MEFLGDQTFNATLALVGLVVLLVGLWMLRRDAAVIADWDTMLGTVVDINHRFLDGADRYSITLQFVDRPDRTMPVQQQVFEASNLRDKIELAVVPGRAQKLILPDGHRTISKLVASVGGLALFVGAFSYIMVLLFL